MDRIVQMANYEMFPAGICYYVVYNICLPTYVYCIEHRYNRKRMGSGNIEYI